VESSRSGSAPVKGPAEGGAGADRAARGWARHLEGWQPAVLAVFIAGSAALLAVPQPVEPTDLPLPVVDGRALARIAEADADRAAALDADPARGRAALELDVDVRALGSAIRAFNLADARPDRKDAEIDAARKRLNAAAAPALAQGAQAVLALRAWQQRAFLRAVRRWESTGEETDELRALGGDVLGFLRQNGWLEEGPGRRRVMLDGPRLAVMFKKRWNRVVGVQGAPFDTTAEEERAWIGFLIAHPARDALPAAVVAAAGRGPAAAQAALERRANEYRLKKITELAAIDPAYPRDLARGVVLYWLGQHAEAVQAFRRHLEASPDGPHTLRAQNYLRAALGRVTDPY